MAVGPSAYATSQGLVISAAGCERNDMPAKTSCELLENRRIALNDIVPDHDATLQKV